MTKSNRARQSPKTTKKPPEALRRSAGRPPRASLADAAPGTKERLLDCALTLFAERGYAATTTAEIIAAARVTKPVLYHYWASKEALFFDLAGAIFGASHDEWETVIQREATCKARLRAILQSTFAGCARDPRIPRLMAQTHYGPAIPALRDFMEQHTAQRFALLLRIMNDGLLNGELSGGNAASLALLFACIMDQHVTALSRLPNAAQLLSGERAAALVEAFFQGCGKTKNKTLTLPPLW